MKIHHLKRVQLIRKPLRDVFAFFERPENLEIITPKSLSFKILSPKPIQMKDGAVIDYTIRIFGIPLKWRTIILEYKPPHYFIDEQAKGPYAHWYHKHSFEETLEGTQMIDEVDYALPFGILGEIAHVFFVKRDLKRIFDYRENVITKAFLT